MRIDLDPPRSALTVAALSVAAVLLKAGTWTNFVRHQAFVVVVFSKITGEPVAEYRHSARTHAEFQVHRLQRRLRVLDIGEMSAHLGVPLASVLQGFRIQEDEPASIPADDGDSRDGS